jgi:hypothetical protein
MNINSVVTTVIFLAVVLLIVVPASAADNPSTVTANEIGIRQAHLSWMALINDVQMNAAINYVNTVYATNTANLTSLLSTYRTTEAQIPHAATLSALNNVTADLRTITEEFRNEMNNQMAIGEGWNTGKLNSQLSAATNNNPYIQAKNDTYWNTLSEGQLGDFDADVQNAQTVIDTLDQDGYNTTDPQWTLHMIVAKRPDLKAALDLRDEYGIRSTLNDIFQLSQQLAQQVTDIQGQVPKNTKIQFLADQAGRAALRGDAINNDLKALLLDVGPEETTVSQMKTDIAGTRSMIESGNIDQASTSLILLKQDLTDLSQEYQNIADSANLPPDLAETMRSLAITLNNAATQTVVS